MRNIIIHVDLWNHQCCNISFKILRASRPTLASYKRWILPWKLKLEGLVRQGMDTHLKIKKCQRDFSQPELTRKFNLILKFVHSVIWWLFRMDEKHRTFLTWKISCRQNQTQGKTISQINPLLKITKQVSRYAVLKIESHSSKKESTVTI